MSNIGLKIRDHNEQQVVDIMTRCHDWLAKKLGIESKLEFGRTCNWGHDAFHAGLWYNNTKQSVLNFRNLYGRSMKTLLGVVAHEARHAVQYKEGWLRDAGRSKKMTHNGRWETGYWKGKYVSTAYKDAPWEKDARAHEKAYSQLVIDAGVISDAELKFRLAGEQDQVVKLEDETRKAIVKKHGPVSWYKASKYTEQQQKRRDKQFDQAIKDAGFIFDSKKQQWQYPNIKDRAKLEQMDKQWKAAKKEYSTKYCDDSIAFLTRTQERDTAKNDRFWKAQQNRVFYTTRPMTDEDLVF